MLHPRKVELENNKKKKRQDTKREAAADRQSRYHETQIRTHSHFGSVVLSYLVDVRIGELTQFDRIPDFQLGVCFVQQRTAVEEFVPQQEMNQFVTGC